MFALVERRLRPLLRRLSEPSHLAACREGLLACYAREFDPPNRRFGCALWARFTYAGAAYNNDHLIQYCAFHGAARPPAARRRGTRSTG